MKVQLSYGRKKIAIDIPDKNILEVVKPKELNSVNGSAPQKAMQNLLESSGLTMPRPTSLILPFILKELSLPKDNITAIFACGTKLAGKDAHILVSPNGSTTLVELAESNV
ncbi:MAG: hypothetical protein AB1485_04190 [Candidatus Thermoplasmatota archaeon]